jgi:hypothetical protein
LKMPITAQWDNIYHKFQRMAKTFVLSDENVNEFGFWLPTAGCDMSQFKRNPIMLWMHNRAYMGREDEVLPLGHWENIRIEGSQILADAIFDQDDEFAQKIESKVESNTLRMASVGIKPIVMSNDPKDLKPGQTYETPIKWKLREASIADIGANDNALALFDENDKLVILSSGNNVPLKKLSEQKPNIPMKNIFKFLGLADNAPEAEVETKVQNLVDTNKTLSDKITALELEKTTLTTKLADIDKQKIEKQKADSILLVDSAVKDGRIEATQKETFLKLFAADFESASSTLAAMKAHTPVSREIGKGKERKENLQLADMSWDQLDKGNKLADLKLNDPELYKEKFEEKFGHAPKL